MIKDGAEAPAREGREMGDGHLGDSDRGSLDIAPAVDHWRHVLLAPASKSCFWKRAAIHVLTRNSAISGG